MRTLLSWASGFLNKFEFIVQTLTRIVLGWVFLETGWGKLTHMERTIEFFQSLNIPGAKYQAPAVALVELVGGLLLVLGLGTRFIAVALTGVMVVAIWTAKMSELEGLSSLFEAYEFTYILLFCWLVVRGAGPLSIDGMLESNTNR